MHLVCLHNVIRGPVDAFDRKCSRITEDEFARFVEEVGRRFDLVSYDTYEKALRSGQVAANCVALSFDDGFLGVHDHARLVLDRHDLTAIAFVNPPVLGNPPGTLFHFLEIEIAFRLTEMSDLDLTFVDHPLDLSDIPARVAAMKRVKKILKARPEAERVRDHAELLAWLRVSREAIHAFAAADPKFRIMDPEHVRALKASGWAIGSHTLTHRTLSMLDRDDLRAEIDGSRDALAAEFGWDVLPFAYPYGDIVHVGDVAPEVCAAAGHPVAFTTVPGPSDFAARPHRLPRIDYKRFLSDHALLRAA